MNCEHNRIVNIFAKCDDRCTVTYANNSYDSPHFVDNNGCVPDFLYENNGPSDYVDITFCADCGYIIYNTFPMDEENITHSIKNM